MVALALMTSVLSACSTMQPIADDDFWGFDGKVSIQQGGETRVLSINWTQIAARSEIQLSGALGMGSADLTVENGLLRVQTGDMDETYPLQGTVLLAGQAYTLPLAQLVYWLRGKQDAGGKPLAGEIESSQWRVKLLRADELGPRLLQLEHPDASLKLRIKRWRFEQPAGAA